MAKKLPTLSRTATPTKHTTTIKPKVLVIVGSTASGKSDLAVELAELFNGEVISADSRQVYKGLTIGSGKITKREMRGIPHHMLDIASPQRSFNASDFRTKAKKCVAAIVAKNKLPIVCGGTGFYIQSLIDNIQFPEVEPNELLRKKLSTLSAFVLFIKLQEIDPVRAENIDPHNTHRLIRAIEIATTIGKVPPIVSHSEYTPLFIGIQTVDDILKQKIKVRLEQRLKGGMVREARTLHEKGLSWKRMETLGLEYRYLARFLNNKITKQQLTDQLSAEIWHYAKRQKTWFKKDSRIHWLSLQKKKTIIKTVKDFLKS